MTKQEYYDLLIQASREGVFPSIKEGTSDCLYRKDMTPKCKQRCPVGLLIPDHRYTPELEGLIVFGNVLSLIEMPDGMTKYDLDAVQKIHDIRAEKTKEPWDSDGFIKELNGQCYFADIKKVNV